MMVQSTMPLSYEQWKLKNSTLVATLSEEQLTQKYKEYEVSVSGGDNASPTPTQVNPATNIKDISQEKDTTNKTNVARSNIDLVGFGQNLQQFGLITGDPTMAKIGAF